MAAAWEYQLVYFDAIRWTRTGLPSDMGEHMDRLGRDGWDLAKVEPILRAGVFASYTAGFIAFFKRPVAAARDLRSHRREA